MLVFMLLKCLYNSVSIQFLLDNTNLFTSFIHSHFLSIHFVFVNFPEHGHNNFEFGMLTMSTFAQQKLNSRPLRITPKIQDLSSAIQICNCCVVDIYVGCSNCCMSQSVSFLYHICLCRQQPLFAISRARTFSQCVSIILMQKLYFMSLDMQFTHCFLER